MARRILISDDFSVMRRIVSKLLSELGPHEITEAEDGDAALSLLRDGAFDCVIVSRTVHLELTSRVRAEPALAAIPILVMTSEPAHHAQVVREGATASIQKPFSAAALGEALQTVMGAV